MNISYIYFAIAFLVGGALSIQAGVNSQLGKVVGNPIIATLITFLVGTVALIAYILVFQRQGLDCFSNLKGLAWYKWTGGIIGAFFVAGIVFVAPQIGVANATALVIAGQIVFALFLDHFGLLDFAQHSMNSMRLLGSGLLVAGVILILRN